jgi:hypothetical protein
MKRGCIHKGMKVDIFGLIFMRHRHEAMASDMKDENRLLPTHFHETPP